MRPTTAVLLIFTLLYVAASAISCTQHPTTTGECLDAVLDSIKPQDGLIIEMAAAGFCNQAHNDYKAAIELMHEVIK